MKQISFCISLLVLLTAPLACKKSENEEKTTADNNTNNTAAPVMKQETKPTVTPDTKPEVMATNMAAAKPAAVETKELTIKGAELTLDTKSGKYKYCTNCRRRASTYDHYYFDKAEYEKMVGAANLKKNVTLKVQILSKSDTNYKPKDPNAPAPHGGFTHNHYTCKIVSVVTK